MPTMLLRFPGGRYHATPHGHHVNEGLVEWPPSPWRLLRALLATGYATQHWTEVPAAGRRLIEALAETLPIFRLPPATLGHSRHYMPMATFDKGREKTTLVFDAWADIGDGTLAVRWNCELDTESRTLFNTLVANLGYLGRSESWVLGAVLEDDQPLLDGAEAFPHVEGQRPGPGWDQVSLLTVEQPSVYADWRTMMLTESLRDLALPEGKKKPTAALLKKREVASAAFPIDALDCIQRDTSWWKQHGWSQAPGSRRVLYWRPSNALRVGTVAKPSSSQSRPVEAMLLALTTPSGSKGSLPAVARALPQAELIHRALVGRVGKGRAIDCPELTGRDGSGKPLKDHQHAHIVPLDLDRDGHLDHVLIYARMGLGHDAQRAIRNLRQTWTKRGPNLQVALAGQGSLNDLRGISEPLRSGIHALLSVESGSTTWVSATPLVLPRHVKRRGANTLEGQINDELTSRGLPPARVEILPWNDQTLKLRHAIRVRRSPAKAPPVDAGHPARLIFDQPVQGPITIGYASHYGLGLFVAEPQ